MPELSGIIQNYLEGSIKTIGKVPVIESKTITENGTYTAPDGVDGYSPITVNVPTPEPSLVEEVIPANGVYLPPEGYDGFSKVTVDVPTPIMDDISITENGVYLPASYNLDGFDEVNVNVPGKSEGSQYKIVKEAGMNLYPTLNGKIYTTWDGGSAYGMTLNGIQSLSNLNSIKCVAHITNSFEYVNKTQLERLQFVYGFTDIQFSNMIYVGYNTGNHIVWSKSTTLTNDQVVDVNELSDISSLTGGLYFFISLIGVVGEFEFTIS